MDAKDIPKAQRLSGIVAGSLDEQTESGDLARRAHQSRTQFFRLFRALIEETPGAMRRRLLLERAAWQLANTRLSITAVAFEANYGSLEAFTRAFRKAFRVSPSLYRRMGAPHIRLAAANGFHFCAPASHTKGECNDMDLFDLFSGAESWHTRRLLEQAATLTDDQLDRPLNIPIKVFPWDTPDQNLRQLLERIVYTKEVWNAALTAGEMPEEEGDASRCTPGALRARFDKADAEFNRILADVRNRQAWSDTFVDALCEPPETFTFGGMFAHVITFNGYRRLTALAALRSMGVNVNGFGCPSEYEASVLARK